MDTFRSIRPVDYALTAVLVALAAFIAVMNVSAGADTEVAHSVDSHSVLMVPVFVAAALPILWRRRNVLAAIAVSLAILAASVPAFGWVTRCGFALPLAAAFAYAVARFAGSRQNRVVGVLGILALQVVVLVRDSSTGGLSGLAVGVPAAALLYGVGALVQSRADKQAGERNLVGAHA